MPVSGDLSINTDSHQVFRAGKAIDLTQREYELLLKSCVHVIPFIFFCQPFLAKMYNMVNM